MTVGKIRMTVGKIRMTVGKIRMTAGSFSESDYVAFAYHVIDFYSIKPA